MKQIKFGSFPVMLPFLKGFKIQFDGQKWIYKRIDSIKRLDS